MLFFLFQARGNLSEFELTMFILGVSSLIFYWQWRNTEVELYLLGVFLGTLIEVGFRFLGYQQVWVDASFFGIPYWLPIAWGMGFVLITRLGVFVRGLSVTD